MASVVVFSATWCGYCRPAKERLRRAGIRYRVVDVDTREGERLADRLRVRAIPAVFVQDADGDLHRVMDPSPAGVRSAVARWSR